MPADERARRVSAAQLLKEFVDLVILELPAHEIEGGIHGPFAYGIAGAGVVDLARPHPDRAMVAEVNGADGLAASFGSGIARYAEGVVGLEGFSGPRGHGDGAFGAYSAVLFEEVARDAKKVLLCFVAVADEAANEYLGGPISIGKAGGEKPGRTGFGHGKAFADIAEVFENDLR